MDRRRWLQYGDWFTASLLSVPIHRLRCVRWSVVRAAAAAAAAPWFVVRYSKGNDRRARLRSCIKHAPLRITVIRRSAPSRTYCSRAVGTSLRPFQLIITKTGSRKHTYDKGRATPPVGKRGKGLLQKLHVFNVPITSKISSKSVQNLMSILHTDIYRP